MGFWDYVHIGTGILLAVMEASGILGYGQGLFELYLNLKQWDMGSNGPSPCGM